MSNTCGNCEDGHRARISRREVLATSALGVAAGLVATTPARALAFPTMNRTKEDAAMTTTAAAIRPFRIQFPDQALTDLRRRLATTRWPEKETVADRSQGNQLATMQQIVQYWGSGYNWRTCEAKLNALPQFLTEIDGLDIHFMHVQSPHKDALPLIVTHGWPGSIVEQIGIIDPLTNPTAYGASASDAFHLVIPSMPGYGFSGKPTQTGWDPNHIGRALGRANGTSGLRALRRAGRRLGIADLRGNGPAGTGGIARHTHQSASHDTVRCRCGA